MKVLVNSEGLFFTALGRSEEKSMTAIIFRLLLGVNEA